MRLLYASEPLTKRQLTRSNEVQGKRESYRSRRELATANTHALKKKRKKRGTITKRSPMEKLKEEERRNERIEEKRINKGPKAIFVFVRWKLTLLCPVAGQELRLRLRPEAPSEIEASDAAAQHTLPG
jgi:hypothetical protein